MASFSVVQNLDNMPQTKTMKKTRLESVSVPIKKDKGKQRAIAPPTLLLPVKSNTRKVKKVVDEPLEATSFSFKIVAGSYEKLLYGLTGTLALSSLSESSSPHVITLKPTFIFPAHVSCIKSVAISPHGGKWLATGSADEIIKVWDLRRKKEVGGLMHHEGSITQLSFPTHSHLLSASEDGTLALFHTRTWTVLRTLKGHSGPINSFAIHPSGKLALSVGKDKTLRMWDLMRGKGCASTKLYKEGEKVIWNSAGTLFVLSSGKGIDVYKNDMNLIYTIEHLSRVHDIHFWRQGDVDYLLVASEAPVVAVYAISLREGENPLICMELIGAQKRVKSIQTLKLTLNDTPVSIACTISSDGFIRVYELSSGPSMSTAALGSVPTQVEPLATYDTKGTRLTCLSVSLTPTAVDTTPVTGKRKVNNTDAELEDQEDVDLASEEGNDDFHGFDT